MSNIEKTNIPTSIPTSKIVIPGVNLPDSEHQTREYFPNFKETYCGIDLMGVLANSKQNPQYTGKDAGLKEAFFDLSKDPIGYTEEHLTAALERAIDIAKKHLNNNQINDSKEKSEEIIQKALRNQEITAGTIPEYIKRFYVTKDILATEMATKYGEEIRIDALIEALNIPDPDIVNDLITMFQKAFIQVVSENDPIAKKVIMKAYKLKEENVAIVSANQKVSFLTSVMRSTPQFKVLGLIDDKKETNDKAAENRIFVCNPIYIHNSMNYDQIFTRSLLQNFIMRLIQYSKMRKEEIDELDRSICLK